MQFPACRILWFQCDFRVFIVQGAVKPTPTFLPAFFVYYMYLVRWNPKVRVLVENVTSLVEASFWELRRCLTLIAVGVCVQRLKLRTE